MRMMMDERESLICLNAVSGLGNVRIKSLCDALGSASAVWKAALGDLQQVRGIGIQIANNIAAFDCAEFLAHEMAQVQISRACVITVDDEDYPECLKQISDSPLVLYVAGTLKKEWFPGIAIVGSRRASVYGLSVARAFAAECADFGVTAVSGMARGIDTAVHYGCLQNHGATVAVLGSGLARVYPRENQKLFDQIVQEGCVISEFAMETGPLAQNFPRRNRVISGLSCGVVVVEAAARSGALITSQCALDQGRDVFAVPGRIGQEQATGTNRLIQQGAKLIFSMQDVFEEIPDFRDRASCIQEQGHITSCELSADEEKIFRVLSDEPMYIDDIFVRTGLDAQTVSRVLVLWECQGKVLRLAGNYFVNRNRVGFTYGNKTGYC